MKWWVAYGFCLLSAACLLAQATRPAPVRKSADGVVFPDAAPRKIEFTLPTIHGALGALPEEAAPRVLSPQKSKTLFEKRGAALNRAEWFALGGAEADVIGLRLTDGRVSAIELAFDSPSDHHIGPIRAALKRMGAQETTTGYRLLLKNLRVDVFFSSGEHSASITFRVQPASWYLAYHQVEQAVADAMRGQRVVSGMTEQEALLSMDGVRHTLTDGSGGRRSYKWEVYSGDASVTAGADSEKTSDRGRLVRTITATVRDGRVTQAHETKKE